MFSRAGLLTIVLADTAMCGWAGSRELAYYGMGSSLHIPLMLIGVGLLTATIMLTAQADGEGKPENCGRVLQVAIWHAFMLGLLAMLLCQLGERAVLATGQTAELSLGAGGVLKQFGWGLPGTLLFVALVFFLEATRRPVAGMVVMILANLLNVFLNWVFIFGNLGVEATGASGAALATSLSRWFMFLALLAYVLTRVDLKRYALNTGWLHAITMGKRFRRAGYPMALGQGLESMSFAMLAIFAGWMGTTSLAAWTICMNMLATVFMLSLGFTTAAGIRVANANGRQDQAAASKAGWTAVIAATFIISLTCLVAYLFCTQLIGLYSTDKAVNTLAIATFMIMLWVAVPDGLQSVLIGALRGVMDFWPATLLQVGSFWLVMVPLGYWLAISEEGDASSLMIATGVGVMVATILLSFRFKYVTTH